MEQQTVNHQITLHYTVDSEVAKISLENGADYNIKDQDKKYPLTIALEKASAKFREEDLSNFLFDAVNACDLKMVRILINEGAPVDHKDEFKKLLCIMP